MQKKICDPPIIKTNQSKYSYDKVEGELGGRREWVGERGEGGRVE